MPPAINKRRGNHQLVRRQVARAKKNANTITINRQERSQLTPYVRKALASNPHAPLKPSKKKVKRLRKLAWISQKLGQCQDVLDSDKMLS